MKLNEKVLLGRLYERTSQRGNRYFSGRLGPARVMLFRDEKADDDNVWQLFVQDGEDKAAQTGQEGEGQQKTTPATIPPWNAPTGRKTPLKTILKTNPCLLTIHYPTTCCNRGNYGR